MNGTLRALLWDVDGTLAETEHDGHLVAFNAAFEALLLPWRWTTARYGELLRVAGGYERLLADLRSQPSARDLGEDDRQALARRIHAAKNESYSQLVSSGALPLRPGVRELLDDCAAAGVRMAVVTTTSRTNVQSLLSVQLGSDWSQRFATVVGAEDAPIKKPDPQAYRVALERLGMEGKDALAIEDSPAGLQAATRAGVPCVIARSRYFPDDPVPEALASGPGLGSAAGWTPAVETGSPRVGLAELRAWHGRHRHNL